MRRILVAFLLVPAVALTACTSPAPAPSSAPPTPSSTPAVPATTVPTSVFPLTCAQLLSVDEASAAAGTTLEVKLDETMTSSRFERIVARQDGDLQCIWGGETLTDTSWDDRVDVRAVPDSTDDFRASVISSFSPEEVQVEGADEASLSGCLQAFGCTLDLLLGTSWLQLVVGSRVSDGDYSDATVIRAATLALGEKLAARIAAAEPLRERWVPSQAGATLDALCESVSAAVAEQAGLVLGLPTMVDQDSTTAKRLGSGYCDFPVSTREGSVPELSETVGIGVLPGGGWVDGGFSDYSNVFLGEWVAQSGAYGATWWLAEGASVAALGVVDHSLVQIMVTSEDRDRDVRQLTSLAATLFEPAP